MPDESVDRPTTGLTRRTLGGLHWTYFGSAFGAILQIMMASVLARLLTPSAFGLVALAALFLRFVDYFAKGGIVQALVQKATLTEADIRAGFTLSAGLGLAFGVLVIAGAPLAGQLAQEPDLVPVLRWLSLAVLLNGLGATAVALLRRDLRFKALAGIEVVSYMAGYVIVGLSLAIAGAGVYALVGAMLTQTTVKAVLPYALLRHPVLPIIDRRAHKAILAFGLRVSIISFLEFLRSNLDTLAVGRWAGAELLGLYDRADHLARLPAYQFSTGLSKVLFPSFAAIQFEKERLRKAYLNAVGMTAALVLPLNAGMAVAAPEIVLVLLGPQWVGSIDVMPWLLLASSIGVTGHFAAIVAEAQGELNRKILVAGAGTLVLAVLLLVVRDRPLSAFAAALAAAALVSHLGYVKILSKTLDASFAVLLRPLGPAVLGALVVAAAIACVRFVLLTWTALATGGILASEVAVGAIALAFCFRLGPLRPYRAELSARLVESGMLVPDGGLRTRLLAALVGQPRT